MTNADWELSDGFVFEKSKDNQRLCRVGLTLLFIGNLVRNTSL